MRPFIIDIKYVEACRKCHGTGINADGEICYTCLGKGIVNVYKHIEITVKPIDYEDNALQPPKKLSDNN